MKVKVIDRQSGKVRMMDDRFARILTKLGRASYMTRDMMATKEAEPVNEVMEEAKPKRRTRKKKEDNE